MNTTPRLLLLSAALVVAACASAPAAPRTADEAPAGERATAGAPGVPATAGDARAIATTAAARPALPEQAKRVEATRGAVTSANALASEAGLVMLRAGGNAVDAAVATAFAIGVVEPQMSGIGGSGAMLVWMQGEGQPHFLDFYAAQPTATFAAATASPPAGVQDMRIVAVPGAVSGLLEAHRRFGRLPLPQVLAPAIHLAEEGFPVGYILAQYVRSDSAKLHRFPATVARLWPDGRPIGAGEMLRNPELADALRAVAERGRAGFDQGPAGRAVVAALNAGGHSATLQDLAAFEPQWKRPLCTTWRDRVVLSAPPPQTGAQVLQTLRLLEPFDLAALGLPTESARAFDVIVSALRVGMADNTGNDDPRWVDVPAAARTSDAFVAARRPLVGTGTAAPAIRAERPSAADAALPPACAPFRPWPATAAETAPAENGGVAGSLDAGVSDGDVASDAGETTHLSVVDADGNAVALTQTNSSTFGSGAWVAGFFLNDSGARVQPERLAAAAAPWRAPTSTIAPTIVLEDGRVRLVTGAPGAGRIPTEIAQTMVYVLDYGLDPLDALRMPRVFPAAGSPVVQLEHGFAPALLAELRAMGYVPAPQAANYARLYMIVRTPHGWTAVADPRHDGEPRGW
jgi:gamma-glutamyltranspeptidase / glutathione hydrolase